MFYYQTSRTELVRVEKQKRKREIKSVVGGVKGQTRPHYNSCNVGPPRQRKRCRTCPAINADPHPHTPQTNPTKATHRKTPLVCGATKFCGPRVMRTGWVKMRARVEQGGIKMAMHGHVVVNPSLSR